MPDTLKFVSVFNVSETDAAGLPSDDSNDPKYVPDAGLKSVAVNAPESPPMQEPVEVNVPENCELFELLEPVKVIVSPL